MKSTVLFLLYNFLIHLALPGVLLRLLWRARKNPAYAQRINERFGFYSKGYKPGGIVVHAVSVGETVAAIGLVEALLAAHPDLPLTLTTTTPTGSARALQQFGDRVQHVYLPYDYPFALARFLKTFKPSQFIIMETEWWPNLFNALAVRKIPLYLANARLSERSLNGYLRIPSLSGRMAASITKVAAQTQTDAQHFAKLGIRPENIRVVGNLKFDFTIDSTVIEQARDLKLSFAERAVWIAASTHAGEEALVIQTIKRVLQERPDALAIVVPRHPERFTAFFEDLTSAGLTVARRSRNERVEHATQVYLGDTMGDLLKLYGASNIAFVGGSFIPAGGHNMLEAAAMGAAILMGPHLENISTQARELAASGGMLVLKDPKMLAEQIIDWFAHPEQRQLTSDQAQAFLQANRGALERTLIFFEGETS